MFFLLLLFSKMEKLDLAWLNLNVIVGMNLHGKVKLLWQSSIRLIQKGIKEETMRSVKILRISFIMFFMYQNTSPTTVSFLKWKRMCVKGQLRMDCPHFLLSYSFLNVTIWIFFEIWNWKIQQYSWKSNKKKIRKTLTLRFLGVSSL